MRRRMRVRLLIAVATLPLLLFAALPLVAGGQTGRIASIQKKSDRLRSEIDDAKDREEVLASDVAVWSRKIGALQSDITTLAARQARIQADLDTKLARLTRIQAELRSERARLARLRRRLADARVVLARRLVDLYKADRPDVVTVILEADGFEDLLQRSEFAKRVSEQDARIIRAVKKAKADATATSKRLARLEVEARRVAAVIESRRDEVARVKGSLVARRDDYSDARDKKQTVLASVRFDRRESERDLAALERESARVAASLRASQLATNLPVGPVRTGSGQLIWPINGPLTSPFGPRWGRLHAGIDIAAPGGTPIRAADSGRVVLAGWQGGYGNYTCIDHGGGFSTCYAHQSSIGVSTGQSVSRGDVIGAVGNTGNSFGDHLHFETRINGSPVDPAGYL